MINNYVDLYEASWDFRITEGGSLLSVIKCKCRFSLVSLSLSAFHLATSTSLSISYFQFSILLSLFVSCVAGQVQRAMLTACPSSLAAGETVTPVIQDYENSMENVCVCVCVFSGDCDSVGRECTWALRALPETAECMDTRTRG